MDSELEKQFSELNKKIEDQFRFTRNVIALCTLAIIGVLIFTIMTSVDSLPTRVIFHYMSNMDNIVRQWNACEKIHARQEGAAIIEQEKKSAPDPASESGSAPPEKAE